MLKLIERSPAVADARRSEISVTAAGTHLLRSRLVTPQERMIEALDQLPPKRLRELSKLLAEVINKSVFELVAPSTFFEADAKKNSRVSSAINEGSAFVHACHIVAPH